MGDLDAVTEAVFRGAAEQKACRDVPTARLRAGLLKDALEALTSAEFALSQADAPTIHRIARDKARAVLAEGEGDAAD